MLISFKNINQDGHGKGIFLKDQARHTHISQSWLPGMFTYRLPDSDKWREDLFEEYLCYFKQGAQHAFLKGHLLNILLSHCETPLTADQHVATPK